jgi:hypothetical protein
MCLGSSLVPGDPFINRARAQALIAQDLDYDGDVDAFDFAGFQACMSGAGVPRAETDTCRYADVDQDVDVDLTDYAVLQTCYSGSGEAADPACGGCAMPRADRQVSASVSLIVVGQSSSIVVSSAQEGANYQLRNDSDNTNVGAPVSGTGGTIYLPTGDLTVTTTFNVLASNALWGCAVQLTDTQTITVEPYSPSNKIGVHVVIGPRNGYGPFIQNCAAAGKPVALVKCVDDFGAAYEAKIYSPQTLTIGRKNSTPNYDLQGFDGYVGLEPADFAQTIFNELRPYWNQNPWIDVWEICNEWSWHWAWQADFYIAMMDLVEAANPPYRIALYGCSGGNPPEAFWPDIARACARAKAHGGHILSLHEYAWDGLLEDEYNLHGDDIVLRYRRLYAYLEQQNADCPLALTEVGENGGGGFVGITPFVNDFGWYDTQMRQDPYVIGCAAWTLGNWSGANFQDALPALTQYIISH